MASKWVKAHGDSGILRKNEALEKIEDLLVFGYACKLFRDDEKALEIDQGKHLIPWTGDETLKIDRYDCRGALSDLSQFEGSSEGYDTARWMGLTDAEKRVEQLCDEERYRALHANEDEEEMYREEELKRLHQQLSNAQNYGQVSYSYETTAEEKNEESDQNKNGGVDDEPFVPRPELDIPVGMTLPVTMKQNARIEKTAAFISEQGAQMEILLKAKQAGNPQFDFLSHESPMYRYYRHILMAIKTGRYRLQDNAKNENDRQEKEEGDDHYLHPSLAPVTLRVESAPSIPNIAYKPSANCAYSMLVNKIRGTKPAEETNSNSIGKNVTTTTAAETGGQQNFVYSTQTTTYTLPPHATYTYNFATGKYEPTTSSYAHDRSNDAYASNVYPQTVTTAQISSQHAYGHNQNIPTMYGANATGNQYSNYAAYAQAFDASYFVGDASGYNSGEITKGAVLYNKTTESDENVVRQNLMQSQDSKTEKKPEKTTSTQSVKQKPILPIAHYSSSSESESEEDEHASRAIINVPQFEMPPEDMQIIIDKMASYVARNGRDFENIVKAKGDPRFEFLQSVHIYNGYYKHKLKSYGAIFEETKETVKTESENESNGTEHKENVKENVNETDGKEKFSVEKEKKVIAPVSFSIKKPKENEPVPIVERSALPVEESSDEENVIEETGDKPREEITTTPEHPEQSVNEEAPLDMDKPEENTENKEEPVSTVIEIDDKQECIDLTDDSEEKKDIKRAEDKIRDKLAAAAREKMSLLSRDKALQLERKRRAAAFLSKIKPTELIVNTANSTVQQKNENNEAEEDDLMKRLAVIDDNNKSVSDNASSNNKKATAKRSRSRSKSNDDRHRHKSSKKKKKSHRDSSPEPPKKSHKRSKHSHHYRDRKKSKKKHRSRSRSRSYRSQSRTSHRTDKYDKETTEKEKNKKICASNERSSGELTPNTSSYSSD